MTSSRLWLDPRAVGLRLYRHTRSGDLIGCELVMFDGGNAALDTVLRRAAVSGAVVVDGVDETTDYFADLYSDPDNWIQQIALDRHSYRSLKNRWARCREDRL